jgi:lysozyme
MPESNVVIDLSHHNQNLNFASIGSSGILGIIHKATQGIGYTDPTYLPHKTDALANGLLWGAYHFGTGSDGIQQAQQFLDVVQPDDQTLLILDFEANGQGPSMTLEEARAFVTHINEETGRYPGLYSGHYIKDLLGTNSDPVLSNCWFWLSQYGPTAVVPSNWSDWTMWQYTDGAVGPQPHIVPGAGMCDRDKFNGDEAALRALWGLAPATPVTRA